jgi:hypothetical protein
VASLGDPRVRDFLAHGTRTGKLAYLAAGGSPPVKVLANFDITG